MNKVRITYAITVCNEFIEIQRLLSFLIANKRIEDNIVVLVDLTKNEPTSELLGYLHRLSSSDRITLIEDRFNGNFADWKNRLTRACYGQVKDPSDKNYIFQIDADEMIDEYVCRLLPQVLEHNQVDVIRVPRINTVSGLTAEHVAKWGWQVNEKGYVNFPDYQWRIYRNTPKIKWKNPVHEVLDGYQSISNLPATETQTEWCLVHDKTIDRQERQNELYSKL
tara:strand:- start:2003 stop:2671 length:669 start_codon:yes stop_codon:yes gene_type:complete